MKQKLSAIVLLFAAASILTGCGDEERLQSELSALEGKISQCTSDAESKYDTGMKAASLISNEGDAMYKAAEVAAAGARNYVFWGCMH